MTCRPIKAVPETPKRALRLSIRGLVFSTEGLVVSNEGFNGQETPNPKRLEPGCRMICACVSFLLWLGVRSPLCSKFLACTV